MGVQKYPVQGFSCTGCFFGLLDSQDCFLGDGLVAVGIGDDAAVLVAVSCLGCGDGQLSGVVAGHGGVEPLGAVVP